jgi:hypothetical protein
MSTMETFVSLDNPLASSSTSRQVYRTFDRVSSLLDCHFHYSTRFATKCVGCGVAILKQFVEINRNQKDECWHPECYMIQKVRYPTSIRVILLPLPLG